MQEKYSNIICAFLTEHSLISVNALEKKLDMPQSTVGKALNGSRLIPVKHIYPLICELAGYGLQIDGYNIIYDSSDHTITGKKWVENIETIEEGDGFAYIVKEYRFFASDYFDLL